MNVLMKLLQSNAPFELLVQHNHKGMECIKLIRPILEAATSGNQDRVKEIAKQIFRLEHEADEIKMELRDGLHRGMILPVARGDLLAYLREQDSIPDKVKDMASMLSARPLQLPQACTDNECERKLLELADLSIQAAEQVSGMVDRLDELKRYAFTGKVAEEIREAGKNVGSLESQSDKCQFQLVRLILSIDDPDWKFAASYTLMEIIKSLSKIANHAENISDYLRLMLAE